VITDAYPSIHEFGKGATTCPSGGQHGTGCAVCATANMLLRWGKSIPRLTDGTPDMISLGTRMGRRHRTVQPGNRHGLSLLAGHECSGGYWCAYCAYLELKANDVPVAYGHLTITQIRAQLDAKHPIVLPGDYNQIRIVSANSFDTKTPARGRVQKYLSTHPFGHMVTAWESLKSSTEGRYGYIVSDPDFGSYSGAPVPPHSIWSDTDLEAFWGLLEWDVCYAITMPPALNVPTPPPPAKPDPNAPVYKYGGRPTSRGSYMVPAGVRIRHDPHVRAGNVIKTTTKPTSFAASQATYAGTNVAGSTLWLGTADGNSWVFKDLTKLVGHTTGREDIR
jgi:hypothetical protein